MFYHGQSTQQRKLRICFEFFWLKERQNSNSVHISEFQVNAGYFFSKGWFVVCSRLDVGTAWAINFVLNLVLSFYPIFDREYPACGPIPDSLPPPPSTFHEICTIDNRWRWISSWSAGGRSVSGFLKVGGQVLIQVVMWRGAAFYSAKKWGLPFIYAPGWYSLVLKSHQVVYFGTKVPHSCHFWN